MLGFSERVIEYTNGLDQVGFEASAMTYDATLPNLELIGEAPTRIPKSVREDSPQIPWRQLIATRNRLVHAYLGVDNDTLWSIIRGDVPTLLEALRQLRQDHSEG